MIIANAVTKTYGSQRTQVTALRSVSLEVPQSQRLGIIGKSGSGKSTLLNLLSGLDQPTSGSLTVGEQRLDQMGRSEMAQYRRQTVGIIFQAFQLLPNRTALQNVEIPLILDGMPRSQRRELALDWLERVGLRERMHHFPYALSGGEQQRVAIARALIHQPRLLLADEPTGNLDSATAEQVRRLIMELCRSSGVTFVLVTHDRHLAAECCERQVRMNDGELSES